MSRQITAQRTREIISYTRSVFNDLDYSIFKTEDELFAPLNDCIGDICNRAHPVIKPDIIFDLVPDKIEYETINLIGTPQSILQVRGVTIISPDNSESPPLIKIPRSDFQKKRSDTSISFPKYYDIDDNTLFILRPYSITGYRVRLRASRLPDSGEMASYTNDPPTPIKYDQYLKYGLVYRAGNMRVELAEKINIPFFQTEYEKFMGVKSKPLSIETEKIEFNELRSYK